MEGEQTYHVVKVSVIVLSPTGRAPDTVLNFCYVEFIIARRVLADPSYVVGIEDLIVLSRRKALEPSLVPDGGL